jgi:hypothetical protein
MTNARGFATLGQVDDVEIKFFLCLRFLRLAARFHTGLYHAIGGERCLSPRTYGYFVR